MYPRNGGPQYPKRELEGLFPKSVAHSKDDERRPKERNGTRSAVTVVKRTGHHNYRR